MTLEIHEQVVRQARRYLPDTMSDEDVLSRVLGMLRLSVECRDVAGQRRFGPFVFMIAGTRVISLTRRGPLPRTSEPGQVCGYCDGTLLRSYVVNGGRVTRPCPRVTDPSIPRCDLKNRG